MMRIFAGILAFFVILGAYIGLTLHPIPSNISYGVTFSTFHAEELGLDWKVVYRAALDELGIRKFRIPAYWNRVEKERDRYAWDELDYQLREAEARDAEVILAVGRRLPRWPECHVPEWARDQSWEEQKEELREYIRATVERYRGSAVISHWQIENEPYLRMFAFEHCGELDQEFLHEEIALVKSLDARPVLVTDSGNLGTWYRPYRDGDAFGTSIYIYFWTEELGQFATKLPPLVYRVKERLMSILFGTKPTFLIELSLEPWLAEPNASAPLDRQLSRMDIQKFEEILSYAQRTSFAEQYLWGVEWWYFMNEKGHPEFWNRAKPLFK